MNDKRVASNILIIQVYFQISNSFLCEVHLSVVCMIFTSLYSWKFLYRFSFCSFSYSLPKEIGKFVRRKDPNKMQHRNKIMFRI